jgi:hypothetical protein
VRTQVQQATAALRSETKPFANAEVVREIRELAQRVSSSRQAVA